MKTEKQIKDRIKKLQEKLKDGSYKNIGSPFFNFDEYIKIDREIEILKWILKK